MRTTVKRPISLEGEIILPGDKSISHRAAILNSLANGDPAHISNFCEGDAGNAFWKNSESGIARMGPRPNRLIR